MFASAGRLVVDDPSDIMLDCLRAAATAGLTGLALRLTAAVLAPRTAAEGVCGNGRARAGVCAGIPDTGAVAEGIVRFVGEGMPPVVL